MGSDILTSCVMEVGSCKGRGAEQKGENNDTSGGKQNAECMEGCQGRERAETRLQYMLETECDNETQM